MNSLKDLRDFLNCSQHDMAALLGISRTALAMYEASHRLLPDPVTRRIIEMLLKAKQISNSKQTVAIPVEEINKATVQIKKRVADLEYILERDGRELRWMTEQYQKSITALHHLALFRPSAKKSSANETIWFDARNNIEKAKMIKCSLEKQSLLRMRVAALEAELAEAKVLLKEMKG